MSSAAQINSLEQRLAAFADRGEAVLVGHANTGLSLALDYLRKIRGPGEVILSPIVCPSLVQTIIYAGFVPVFVDVVLPLCTIDPSAAEKAVGPRTRAILPIHIFGHSADMTALAALAERHDIWLIEDAAQSLGGNVSGRRHGGWGNVSLYSFGGSKIVSAGGGGALLSDNSDVLSYVRREAARLPPLTFDPAYELLSLSHRNLIHGLMDALRARREAPVSPAFSGLLDVYRPLYAHAFPDDDRILRGIVTGLDSLDENLRERRQRAAAYWSGFAGLEGMLQLPGRSAGSGAVWRFTTIVADARQAIRLTNALRKSGLHASNHYWSVAELLHGDRSLPNADFASPRLLNLWVEPTVANDDIARTVEIVRNELVGVADV